MVLSQDNASQLGSNSECHSIVKSKKATLNSTRVTRKNAAKVDDLLSFKEDILQLLKDQNRTLNQSKADLFLKLKCRILKQQNVKNISLKTIKILNAKWI